MSAPLEIPDAAWDAVAAQITAQDSHAAAVAGGFEVAGLVGRGVEIAAPFIVVAELQRLLDMPEPRDVWVAIARRIRDLDPS